MMTKSVEENDKIRFAQILKLISDLRRADCADGSDGNYNVFRRFNVGTDLGNALARRLGEPQIPDSTNAPFGAIEHRRQVFNHYFEEYASLSAEPKLVGSFLTQNEDYETERHLRSEIRELRTRSELIEDVHCTASGILALFSLSALLSTILFESALVYFRKHSGESGKIPNTMNFWVFAILAAIVGALVFENAMIASGIDNRIGFGPIEPRPLISANTGEVLFLLLAWTGVFAAVFFDWRKGKLMNTHWRITMLAGFAYLSLILLMALYRSELAALLVPGRMPITWF